VADAVVIGAGPNGLVAANLLADRGWDVLVLEAGPTHGGAVQSRELIEPGYVNDCFSAFYPLAVASPIIQSLQLEDFGLRWLRAPIVLAHPASDGTCPVVSMNIDETAESLDTLHHGDGDAYRALYARWERMRGGLLAGLFAPMPPIAATAKLLAGVVPDGPVRFARFALLSARRMGFEEFGAEGSRRLLAGSTLHADLSPEDVLSGFFGWLLMCLGQDVGWPVPEGGAGRLTDALAARLRARGGRIECNAEVDKVIVRNGRAVAVRARGEEVRVTRAVLADVDAPRLYLDLVGTAHLKPRLVDDLRRFAWDHSTVKVDWNLDGPIPWKADGAQQAGTVHLVESVDEMSEAASHIVRSLLPARPFLIIGQQSMTDPTRMPPGKETAWAYTHISREVRGDAAGEIEVPLGPSSLEQFVDRMQARIEELAPGFGALIRARQVMGPGQLEHANQNLHGGAINGGTAALSQQLVFRPTPGLGRPETPIRGLYLASSSAHPGGGVHGACGSNAARAALLHDRIARISAARKKFSSRGFGRTDDG
jgi:phytoene dehydrogenase-like protein